MTTYSVDPHFYDRFVASRLRAYGCPSQPEQGGAGAAANVEYALPDSDRQLRPLFSPDHTHGPQSDSLTHLQGTGTSILTRAALGPATTSNMSCRCSSRARLPRSSSDPALQWMLKTGLARCCRRTAIPRGAVIRSCCSFAIANGSGEPGRTGADVARLRGGSIVLCGWPSLGCAPSNGAALRRASPGLWADSSTR